MSGKQVSYYKDLMDRCGDKRVVFPSLDVGSDETAAVLGFIRAKPTRLIGLALDQNYA